MKCDLKFIFNDNTFTIKNSNIEKLPTKQFPVKLEYDPYNHKVNYIPAKFYYDNLNIPKLKSKKLIKKINEITNDSILISNNYKHYFTLELINETNKYILSKCFITSFWHFYAPKHHYDIEVKFNDCYYESRTSTH